MPASIAQWKIQKKGIFKSQKHRKGYQWSIGTSGLMWDPSKTGAFGLERHQCEGTDWFRLMVARTEVFGRESRQMAGVEKSETDGGPGRSNTMQSGQ